MEAVMGSRRNQVGPIWQQRKQGFGMSDHGPCDDVSTEHSGANGVQLRRWIWNRIDAEARSHCDTYRCL
jgi:hypothetical protein